MATQSFRHTQKTVAAIMNRRGNVTEQQVGKGKIRFTIVGDGSPAQDVKTKEGTLVQSVVEPGTVAQKIIFNLNANSALAMKNPDVRQLSKEGYLAEKEGDMELAHEKYQAFLNATQISFNVFTTDRILKDLGDRVDIAAEVISVPGANGNVLTIDPKSIQVMRPDELAKTTFSFDFEDEEDQEADPQKNPESVGDILNQA